MGERVRVIEPTARTETKPLPGAVAEDGLGYVLEPGPHGAVACLLRFPGDPLPRPASLDSKRKAQAILKQPFLTPIDRRVLMQLYMLASPGASRVLLRGRDGARVLRALTATRRLFWDRHPEPLRLRDDATTGSLAWEPLDLARQVPVIRTGVDGSALIATTPPYLYDPEGQTVQPVDAGVPDEAARLWLTGGTQTIDSASVLCRRLETRFPGVSFPAPVAVESVSRTDIAPGPVLILQTAERLTEPNAKGESRAVPLATLHFAYHRIRIAETDEQMEWPTVEEGRVLSIRRQIATERGFRDELLSLGLQRASSVWGLEAPEGLESAFALPDQSPEQSPESWHSLLSENLARLESNGWTVCAEPNRRILTVDPSRWFDGLTPGAEPGTFHFDTGFEHDGERISAMPYLRDWASRSAPAALFMPARPGETFVAPPEAAHRRLDALFELTAQPALEEGGKLTLTASRVVEVAAALDLDLSHLDIPEWQRHLALALRDGLETHALTEPEGLRATLRDYQREGIGWLRTLSERGLSGILADDMGLGKTLQTIAHLLAERDAGRFDGPALLVAPTSLIQNWQSELKRFAPQLSLLTLTGKNRRTAYRAVPEADVVLTTYALVRRDAEWHLGFRYAWIILDEAQAIKNPNSGAARTLCKLSSERRLCLTGTPVENHLGELWSLFHFLMPGFLGDREGFRLHFQVPIEQERSEVVQALLQRRVRPFLLRRTKAEVVQELPPKTVIRQVLEMTGRQRQVYERVRLTMRQRVVAQIQARGLARSKIVIIDALMKLRQICCDPRLAKLDDVALKPAHSAKLARLMEMLPALVDAGHRILVFSQFTSMLDLIEEELRRARLDHTTLTGATTDRARCVDAFQKGRVPIFLISLRAGGTGLNLTRADTVIHFDPWWNPQVENQATDRAYRIGQDKPVIVHKLILENTVEEKIVAMQDRKAALAKGILSGAPEEALDIGEEEVEELFGP